MYPKSDDPRSPWVGALVKIVAMLVLMTALLVANVRTSTADADPARTDDATTAVAAPQVDADGSITRAASVPQ